MVAFAEVGGFERFGSPQRRRDAETSAENTFLRVRAGSFGCFGRLGIGQLLPRDVAGGASCRVADLAGIKHYIRTAKRHEPSRNQGTSWHPVRNSDQAPEGTPSLEAIVSQARVL